MELGADSNLFDLFLGRVHATPPPNAPAYRQFVNDVWVDVTWAEVAREVARFRAALAREGLKPGERVALCLRNRVEWVCFDQAAASLGLVTVPLYFDDRPDNMAYCLNDAGCKLLLLENAALWPALRAQAKSLVRVVCLDRVADDDPRLTCLRRLAAATRRCAGARAITSGRARDPGLYLGHHGQAQGRDAVASQHPHQRRGVAQGDPGLSQRPVLSFLPLSHMFERTCGYYLAIRAGAQTVYARSISLLAEDLRTQRPECVDRSAAHFRAHPRPDAGKPAARIVQAPVI